MSDNIAQLNNILASFNIKAACVAYNKIRNVSLYDLVIDDGTRVRDIQKYADEIALRLKAQNKPLVRIKSNSGVVRLEMIDEEPHKIVFFDELAKQKKDTDYTIPMYLGNSIDGEDITFDMSRNPHMIIGGCTGSGKSTLLNVIIANALGQKNTNVYLIDTKNIEYGNYADNISNIRVATDYDSGLDLLCMLNSEMEYRYSLMRERQLSSQFFTSSCDDFPSILFIIDEFADIIMQDEKKIFYKLLCKLSQKCRAAGIYCVLATQRPSVDVISGSIKANFPARIACQVASGFDSKVILDTVGSELLAGRGDAIVKNYKYNYTRFQAAYTDADEVSRYYARV
jgi:DNA segregation ATPase FtsK/SpoIIIE, S-DNA-T family